MVLGEIDIAIQAAKGTAWCTSFSAALQETGQPPRPRGKPWRGERGAHAATGVVAEASIMFTLIEAS